jgi:hypothetical protein
MQRYGNLSGDSGVVFYESGDGEIVLRFVDGWHYRYTDASAGAEHIAAMRRLARAGRGLSTYVSRVVREGYAERWR